MDRLFSKYADPFSFLNAIIQTYRFLEFVREFLEIENEERQWEFYLHKVYDKSYSEWKQSICTSSENSEKNVETTIVESKQMIMNFVPN